MNNVYLSVRKEIDHIKELIESYNSYHICMDKILYVENIIWFMAKYRLLTSDEADNLFEYNDYMETLLNERKD